MKLLDPRSAFLSNHEVEAHLRELSQRQDALIQAGSYSTALESENLRTIQYELGEYLEREPCRIYTTDQLAALMQALKHWQLTKVERLMLVNQVPNNRAELEPLVEELSERFDEQQVQDLIDLVIYHLGRRPALDEEQQGDDGRELGEGEGEGEAQVDGEADAEMADGAQ